MRCHICDKQLSEKEIVFSGDNKTFEPCTDCLEIIYDAAYCDGFSYDEADLSTILIDEPYSDDAEYTFAKDDDYD